MKLSGYKTYIIGVVLLVVAIVGQQAKVLDTQTAAILVGIALTTMGLRSGIKKLE